MKVAVIGQGGREHALVRALSLSLSVTEVHCIPGSEGIGLTAICHNVDPKETDRLVKTLKKNAIDLVVIGPEQPLADGLADILRAENLQVFGPSARASQLEASKQICKEFLQRHQIPTARSTKVTSVEETVSAAQAFQPPFVLKADGLAAGKGVIICPNLEDLKKAADDFFVRQTLGAAGHTAILEEHLSGWELSYLLLTNGEGGCPLPLAQDHKRLFEKDRGPNTGGMGTVAPMKISPELLQQIQSQIVEPTLKGFKEDELDYRGVLFIGIMVTQQGPKVLEFNVRFGDPETQVVLPLLDGDWGEVLMAIARGELPELKWRHSMAAACVVLAAQGYPENPIKGAVIAGQPNKQTASSYFLHAGTAKDAKGNWVTNGGRVLNAIGLGSSLSEALKQAYTLVEHSQWEGMQFRRDIGDKATSSN